MRGLAWIAAILWLTICGIAQAETVQWANSPRVYFRDLVPQASGNLASLDLGQAPPPGGSRLYSNDELRTFAYLAHESLKGLDIPNGVRVKRATRHLSELDLDSLIRPALSVLLPEGVLLKNLNLPKTLISVPGVQVGDIQMPRLPKHAGMSRISPVVQLMAGGVLVMRLTISADLQLDERASRYALERGSMINLVIDTGTTRISAAATLSSPADVGDIVACQVVKTHKVLRARITSTREAAVVLP